MPIYAYKCESCEHAKDVLQKISDPLLTVCPACGQATFKKQLTAAGFQLKGSGWYVTDFKGGADGGAAKGGKAGDPAQSTDKAGSTSVAESAPGGSSSESASNKTPPATASAAPAAVSPAGSGSKPSSSPATGV